MNGRMLFSLALVCTLFSSALAQEFPLGIWFAGNSKSVDSVSAMGFTWVQAYGGWDTTKTTNFDFVLKNSRDLKVIATLERNVQLPSFAQRMNY